MDNVTTVFDPTQSDSQSKVRGVGRYISLLKDSFPLWNFSNTLLPSSVFINPFINLLQPPHIAKRYGKKQVGVLYDLIPIKYPAHFPAGFRGNISFLRNRLALRTYDHFVTDSQVAKQDIVDILHVPSDKITVIYPYVADCAQEAKLALPPSYYLYVGDATWNKNLVNLAKAIKRGTTPCVFVGKVFSSPDKINASNTWTAELVEFLKMAKGDSRFIFPGFISDSELTAFYKNALCNILISRDEGFGFSYVEAAKNGTPSLLADRPIFHETAGTAALFCDPENPQAIYQELQKMKDMTVRTGLCFKALERSKMFNKEVFFSKWNEVVER